MALVLKNLLAIVGDIRDAGLIPGSGRSLEEGMYSCLKIPMDRGPWGVMVHRVTNSQTGLKQLSMHT